MEIQKDIGAEVFERVKVILEELKELREYKRNIEKNK